MLGPCCVLTWKHGNICTQVAARQLSGQSVTHVAPLDKVILVGVAIEWLAQTRLGPS
jgi:hypothetical protein